MTCGMKLAFAMCLLQCLHCIDEAHIAQNRGSPVCSEVSRDLICPRFSPGFLHQKPSCFVAIHFPNSPARFRNIRMVYSEHSAHSV